MISEETKKAPTQLGKVEALLQAALKLQKEANSSSHSEAINLLASAKEREEHLDKSKEGRRQASEILEQLASLIDLIDPAAKLQAKVVKNKASLLKDLTGLPSASAHYQASVE